MKYLDDSLKIIYRGKERSISVSEIAELVKASGREYRGSYTLVTGGMSSHEAEMTGVPVQALLELMGIELGNEAVTAYFKDAYIVRIEAEELLKAKKPVIIAYECGGLPLIGPTGREPIYKHFGEKDGYFKAAGNSGGPLRLVSETEGNGPSNAPSCGKWLAALAVGEHEAYAFKNETDPEPEGELPASVPFPEKLGKFLTVRIFGREVRLGFEDMTELEHIRALFSARDGRYAFEGLDLRELIESLLLPGETFPQKISVSGESGYAKEVDINWVLNGIESSYQPGERREVILAYASSGAALVRETGSEGYVGANDGAPMRLIAENYIAHWIKNVCLITAE